MGYDTCVPADTDHHQAIGSLLGGFGWRERKKWLIPSPILCDTCGMRETREAWLYVRHLCVLVGELGNLGPGSGYYSLTGPPGQDCAPEWPVPALWVPHLRHPAFYYTL